MCILQAYDTISIFLPFTVVAILAEFETYQQKHDGSLVCSFVDGKCGGNCPIDILKEL
jgi:hypothetical protein